MAKSSMTDVVLQFFGRRPFMLRLVDQQRRRACRHACRLLPAARPASLSRRLVPRVRAPDGRGGELSASEACVGGGETPFLRRGRHDGFPHPRGRRCGSAAAVDRQLLKGWLAERGAARDGASGWGRVLEAMVGERGRSTGSCALSDSWSRQ